MALLTRLDEHVDGEEADAAADASVERRLERRCVVRRPAEPISDPALADVRICSLYQRVGVVRRCTADGCPFWEPGGAALPAGCLLDRLSLDLDARPGLVRALLQARRTLERAATPEDEDEARAVLRRLLPAGDPD
jgi:hypothetical protein